MPKSDSFVSTKKAPKTKQKAASQLRQPSGGKGIMSEIGIPVDFLSMGNFRISLESFYTIYRSNGDVFAAIRELRENCGSAGYEWKNALQPDKDADLQAIKAAEALLSYKSNFRTLKNRLLTTQFITGNSYVLILTSEGGKPLGFDIIDPRTMTAVTDKYGNILRWIQRSGADTQDFKADEVKLFKMTDDPNSPVFGLSPLEPILWEVRTDMAAMISNFAFFANDAQPGAQYILDEGIVGEEADKIVEGLKTQLKGAENRNKSVVLQGVKEIKTLAISQKDMEFNLLRRFTTEKVCSVLGVPKSILNYTDDVNYSNGQEQTRKFWEGTINPLQETLEDFINRVLLPAVGITTIKLKFKSRKFDNREWDEASSRADQALGNYTINEVRKLRGLEPFDAAVHGEWVDKPILANGSGARPLEDLGIEVGADGLPAILSEDEAAKEISRIDKMAGRYNQGRNSKSNQDIDAKAERIAEKKIATIKKELEKQKDSEVAEIKKELTEKVDAVLRKNK